MRDNIPHGHRSGEGGDDPQLGDDLVVHQLLLLLSPQTESQNRRNVPGSSSNILYRKYSIMMMLASGKHLENEEIEYPHGYAHEVQITAPLSLQATDDAVSG